MQSGFCQDPLLTFCTFFHFSVTVLQCSTVLELNRHCGISPVWYISQWCGVWEVANQNSLILIVTFLQYGIFYISPVWYILQCSGVEFERLLIRIHAPAISLWSTMPPLSRSCHWAQQFIHRIYTEYTYRVYTCTCTVKLGWLGLLFQVIVNIFIIRYGALVVNFKYNIGGQIIGGQIFSGQCQCIFVILMATNFQLP